MAFGDLATKGLEKYLADNRFTDELAVFIHIPKTAGSSLSTELERLRPPYHNIHRKYDTSGATVTFSRIEDEMQKIVDSGVMADARSCSGHFSWTQSKPLRDVRPDARFFTFLRDPVKRIISDYRYSRTPTHPTYKETIARFPTVESYIEASETQDKMAKFLLPNNVNTRREIEEFVDTQLVFVGLLEMYPMSFNILSRLMGENLMPVEHKRKTEKTAENEVDETPQLLALIAESNARDKMLYDIVRKRLVGARDQWRELRGGKAQAA